MSQERWVWTATLTTGVRVRVVSQGAERGTPVLLLHAWVESSGVFDRLLARMPDDQWVVTFDQRGHGESDRPESGYGLRDFAADVIALIDELGVPSAVLVGSSSGGYVAQQVALEHPERVTALVLVGSPRSLQGLPPFADDVLALQDPVTETWVRDSLGWFRFFTPVPEWYLEDRIAEGVTAPARVWRSTLLGLSEAVPPTEAGRITAPTLVISGGRDDLLPLSDQEKLVAAVPGARHVVYDDAGHLVLWEQPRRVARDVEAFLADSGVRRGS